MAVDNSFIIQKIKNQETMIVAYCAFTGMPLMVCDDDTANDQVWIFDKEDQLKEFAQPYLDRKVAIQGRIYKNADFLKFFSSLFSIGANEVVFVDETGTRSYIELGKLVNEPDYSKLDPSMRPVMNPNLQLTGLYFMQEAARPIPNEEKTELADLEEELSANMVKARYIIPIDIPQEGEGTDEEKMRRQQYRIPMLKNKQGDTLMPIFTDPFELQKFLQGKKMSAIAVPFADLLKMLMKDAKGYILNPMGFHLMMPPQLLEGLNRRFQ